MWHASGEPPASLFLGTPHRVLDSGSTNPIVFQLDDASGPSGFWVVKFPSRDPKRGLALLREQIGSDIASHLGVATPKIGWLRIPEVSPRTDESRAGRVARDAYEKDRGKLAFCSHYVEAATTVAAEDLTDLRSIGALAQEDALRVFAFDVLVRHYDRSRTNSNLLSTSDRLEHRTG